MSEFACPTTYATSDKHTSAFYDTKNFVQDPIKSINEPQIAEIASARAANLAGEADRDIAKFEKTTFVSYHNPSADHAKNVNKLKAEYHYNYFSQAGRNLEQIRLATTQYSA